MSRVTTLTDVKPQENVEVGKVVNVIKLLHKSSKEFQRENQELFDENQKLKTDVSRMKEGVAPSVLECEELKSVIDDVLTDVKGWSRGLGRKAKR